ncbi:MAG: cadherin-like beta sandwich domain-containing protein [Lachnospiraceae bacterium]|nr:cadherin-like beta sandwich domain-containing protein [Lachnospiraceae bacterium]
MSGRRKIIRSLICAALLFVLVLPVRTSVVSAAASAAIKVASVSCEKGQTVTVSVTVSTTVDMAMYQYTLSYDTAVLQYQSGDADGESAGTLRIIKESASGTSQTLKFTFKSLAVGSSKVSVSDYIVCPTDIAYDDSLPTTVTNGTVTVKAPYQASTNANLKSLSVGQGSLSPAFSKSVYEYAVSVGGGVDRLTVSASPEDSKATVKVSGNTNLKEGANTVTIKVTAEDGKTTKTYKIIVTRAKPSPTPSPTPSLTPEPTATPTQGVTVAVGEQTLTLSDVITAQIPEGFEETTFEYENVTVPALRSLSGELLLVQMDDGKLYLYRPADNGFVPYQVITAIQKTYTVLPLPASETVPEGYIETVRTIGAEEVTVYVNSEDSESCLVYAMNWNGDCAWYRYDGEEATMQRVFFDAQPQPGTGTPVPSGTPTPKPSQTAPDGNGSADGSLSGGAEESSGKLSDMELWTLLGLSGVLFCLMLLFLSLYLHERNRHAESVDAGDAEEEHISLADLETAAVAENEPEPVTAAAPETGTEPADAPEAEPEQTAGEEALKVDASEPEETTGEEA